MLFVWLREGLRGLIVMYCDVYLWFDGLGRFAVELRFIVVGIVYYT